MGKDRSFYVSELVNQGYTNQNSPDLWNIIEGIPVKTDVEIFEKEKTNSSFIQFK